MGIPPFGGFVAKLTILSGLGNLQEYIIIGAILLISLIEATYLFRIISLTRTTNTEKNIKKISLNIPILQKIVLSFIAFIIIYIGINPHTLLMISQSVAESLLGISNV